MPDAAGGVARQVDLQLAQARARELHAQPALLEVLAQAGAVGAEAIDQLGPFQRRPARPAPRSRPPTPRPARPGGWSCRSVRRSCAAVCAPRRTRRRRRLQRARAVEPGRQVAERRVAQPQVGVDGAASPRAGRSKLDQRVGEVVQLLRRRRRPPRRRPGASAPAPDCAGMPSSRASASVSAAGCRGPRASVERWPASASSSVASMFSVTQSTMRRRRARADRRPPAAAMLRRPARARSGETRTAS